MATTALQKAVGDDGKVKTDNPNLLKQALQAATDLVEKGDKKVERMKERAGHAMHLGMLAAEVQSTAFVASMRRQRRSCPRLSRRFSVSERLLREISLEKSETPSLALPKLRT